MNVYLILSIIVLGISVISFILLIIQLILVIKNKRIASDNAHLLNNFERELESIRKENTENDRYARKELADSLTSFQQVLSQRLDTLTTNIGSNIVQQNNAVQKGLRIIQESNEKN